MMQRIFKGKLSSSDEVTVKYKDEGRPFCSSFFTVFLIPLFIGL